MGEVRTEANAIAAATGCVGMCPAADRLEKDAATLRVHAASIHNQMAGSPEADHLEKQPRRPRWRRKLWRLGWLRRQLPRDLPAGARR